MCITIQVIETLLRGKYVHNNPSYRNIYLEVNMCITTQVIETYSEVNMCITIQVIETLLRGKYVHNNPSYRNFTQR